MKDAAFIPPVWQEVDPLMGDLENFLHKPEITLPRIVKIAIAHYQFETIHPFLDGNGRIGRLMIPLYLIQERMLSRPVFYLSAFFEQNRSLYYDHLTAVREKNELGGWLKFFLIGVIETGKKSVSGLKKIMELKKDCEENRIPTLGKKLHSSQVLLNHLFTNPVVRPPEVAQLTGLSSVSAYKLIEDFERLKILRNLSGSRRHRVFIFDQYFDLFSEGSK